jgi:AcrR family transcriptional regulator
MPDPAPGDPRDTRARLLDAAEQLFADRGFSAVSIRDIAGAAAVNVAAVNYHFHGKQSLYHEVLRRVATGKRERYLAAIRRAAAGPEAGLEDVVAGFYRIHFEDTLKTPQGGNFVKLLVREMHHGSLEGARILQDILMPMWAEMTELTLQHLPGVAAELAPWIAGSLHGQLVHFTMRWHQAHGHPGCEAAAGAFRTVFPPLADDVDTYIDAAVAHITRFSVAGIRAVAASPAPGAVAGRSPEDLT